MEEASTRSGGCDPVGRGGTGDCSKSQGRDPVSRLDRGGVRYQQKGTPEDGVAGEGEVDAPPGVINLSCLEGSWTMPGQALKRLAPTRGGLEGKRTGLSKKASYR